MDDRCLAGSLVHERSRARSRPYHSRRVRDQPQQAYKAIPGASPARETHDRTGRAVAARARSEGRGPRTRHYALQRLRTALNEAAARGHIMRNVAALAKTPRQESKKHAAPNAADIERLVAAMRGERLEPLLLVLLGTGLRRQEVLGLTCERTHLEGPYPELRVDKPGRTRRRPTGRTGGSKNGSWATARTTRAVL